MKNLAPIFAAAVALVTTLGFAGAASAQQVESCGNFEFGGNVDCEMRVEGGCTASCEPVSFEAQCAADLYVDCQGGCNVNVDVGCSAKCDVDCQAKCDVNPGSFDCSASCRADCGATCAGRCAAGAAGSKCRASCEASCGGECDASCKVVKPTADCKAKCSASCEGSCHADANMKCQIDCQSKAYVSCETELKGGCEAACSKPEGALFCNGQYVDPGAQIDQCIADLQAAFDIEVTGYADGSANCSGNRCTAEGEAGFSCSQGSPSSSGNALAMLGAIAAFGMAFGRRKKS